MLEIDSQKRIRDLEQEVCDLKALLEILLLEIEQDTLY